MTGVVPVVVDGSVSRVALQQRALVLPSNALPNEQENWRRDRRRNVATGSGLLNADQQMFLEANICPFCMAPLDGV